MPTNSQKKADYKKERCGNLLLYPTDRLLAFAFGTDKTIAHTKGYVKSQLWLYTPMMWVLLLIIFVPFQILREFVR